MSTGGSDEDGGADSDGDGDTDADGDADSDSDADGDSDSDPPADCGDDVCGDGETVDNCPEDCYCGNVTCDQG